MKIYVITAGEYSDYGIVCVFTDKDKAEHFVNLHNDYAPKYSWAYEYEIKEYDSKDEEYSIDDDAGLMYSYAPYQIAYGATGAVRVVTRAEYERIKANDPNHIYFFSRQIAQTKALRERLHMPKKPEEMQSKQA